jgi:hypothetical protein
MHTCVTVERHNNDHVESGHDAVSTDDGVPLRSALEPCDGDGRRATPVLGPR